MSIEKNLKYLCENRQGSAKDLLKKFPKQELKPIYKSGFLKIEEMKYFFTEEGVDCYVQEYGQYEKKNVFGF